MGSTYMDLTNRLLRRLNEVEISQSDFPSVRNIQATCKDAIQDSVRMINNHRTNWPFNASSGSQLLVVGQEEYSWPADFAKADWESFQIQKDSNLSVNSTYLRPIPKELWYAHLRDLDDDTESDGRGIPDYVFSTHGSNWGVSPSPDKAYTVNFNYFYIPTDMSDYDDTTTIPTRFDYVIMAAGLYYLNMFKGDSEATAESKNALKVYLKDMVNQLLPNENKIYVKGMNPGRVSQNSYMWTGR